MEYKNTPLDSLAVSTPTDILVPTAGKRVGVTSLSIVSNEATAVSNVTITRCNAAGDVLSTLWRDEIPAGGSFCFNPGWLIPASDTPQKLRVESDQDAVSADISWWEA